MRGWVFGRMGVAARSRAWSWLWSFIRPAVTRTIISCVSAWDRHNWDACRGVIFDLRDAEGGGFAGGMGPFYPTFGAAKGGYL
jgi:hypothetical protein